MSRCAVLNGWSSVPGERSFPLVAANRVQPPDRRSPSSARITTTSAKPAASTIVKMTSLGFVEAPSYPFSAASRKPPFAGRV